MSSDVKALLKKLNKLMIPIALQALMLAAVAASDSLMLGFVSQDQLAAVSLATRVQFVQNIFISTFVGGATVLAAQYYGKKDTYTVDRIFGLLLKYGIIISILFWAISFFLAREMMVLFTDDTKMIKIGAGYLRIASWSYLVVGITQAALAKLKVINKANLSAIIGFVSFVLNIGLNVIFIFGLLGSRALGADGAALATLIARIVELIMAIIFVIIYKCVGLRSSDLIVINKELEGEYWRVTRMLLLGECLWGIGVTVYSAIIGHLGSDVTAANSLSSIIRDLATSLCRGVGLGGGIIVGYSLGQGKLDKAKEEGAFISKLSIIVGFICAILVVLSMPLVLQYDKLSDVSKEYLKGMLLMSTFYMVGKSINVTVINGIFSAGGDTSFDWKALLVTVWGIIIPFAALGAFVLNWNVMVIYFIISLDEILKLPWLYFHYKKYRWLKKLTKEKMA